MDERLNSYDWSSAFYEAQCHTCGEDSGDFLRESGKASPVPPGSTVPDTGFSREDVAELFGIVDGENDESDWVCCGRLNDGRFFALRAGCDYTGWDCQAGGSADVAATKEDILQFGLSEQERGRLGL